MVQYIITPWRNRQELLSVKQAFYPESERNKATREAEQRNAVALVSVWIQRGNCPHSVESTALLVSAILNEKKGNLAYAMRAAYSAAFCRFVTGLLDGYQDRRHKMSMYSIAKTIGLPATFVELRHQCTHEELPSLTRLRDAAQRSLTWIYDHYWKKLELPPTEENFKDCRTAVLEYLNRRAIVQSQDTDQYEQLVARLQNWNTAQIQDMLMEILESPITEPKILLQAVRLSKEMLSGKGKDAIQDFPTKQSFERKTSRSLEAIRVELAEANKVLQEDETLNIASQAVENEQDVKMADNDANSDKDGWQMWKGPWIPKPIGVV